MGEEQGSQVSGHLVVEQDESRIQRGIRLLFEFLDHFSEAHIKQAGGLCHRNDFLGQNLLHLGQLLVGAFDLFFCPVDSVDLFANEGKTKGEETKGQTVGRTLVTGNELINKAKVTFRIGIFFGVNVSGKVGIFPKLLVLLCLNLGCGLEQSCFTGFEFIARVEPILVNIWHGLEIPGENELKGDGRRGGKKQTC